MHIFAVRFLKQAYQIFIGSITRCHCIVIFYIIARISKRGLKTWIDPNRITPQILNVIQFFNNTIDITNSVRVRIAERLRINLIKHSVIKPFRLFSLCHHYNLTFLTVHLQSYYHRRIICVYRPILYFLSFFLLNINLAQQILQVFLLFPLPPMALQDVHSYQPQTISDDHLQTPWRSLQ